MPQLAMGTGEVKHQLSGDFTAIPTPFDVLVYSSDSNGNPSFARVQQVQVSHSWTCNLLDYNRRDGICDCNCGQYDPGIRCYKYLIISQTVQIQHHKCLLLVVEL